MIWPVISLASALDSSPVFVDGDWVESKDQDPEGDVRLIQLADIGDGYYVNKSSRFMTSESAQRLNCTFLEPGDVLVARMPDPLGRACIFPGDTKRAVTVVDVCIIRPDTEKVHAPWLMHCINSPQSRNQISGYITGTTRARISRANLAKVGVHLPPLEEQRRIAAIFDQAETLRTQRRTALALLDSLTQSLFLDMFGDPVKGDGRYSVQAVETIASEERYSIVDGPFGSAIKQSDYLDSGIPVIRIGNLTKDGYYSSSNLLYIGRTLFESLKRSNVLPGDVLISRVGTLGNTCIYPPDAGEALLSTTGVCKIKVNPKVMLAEYLHAAIRCPSFQEQIQKSASTSVQKYFNLSWLCCTKVCRPAGRLAA